MLAQEYEPDSETLTNYLDAISRALGQGENAEIRNEIPAVVLPASLAEVFERPDFARQEPDYDSFYLFRATGYALAEDEARRESYFRQVKIQNQAGVERFATLTMDFDPSYQSFFVNRLVVRDVSSGEIVATADPDSYYVTDATEDAEADYEQTAHLPVPGLRPGVVIEWIATIRSNGSQMPVEHLYLSSSRPIQESAVFISGKVDGISFATHGLQATETSDSLLLFRQQQPPAYQSESMMPDVDKVLPWVKVGATEGSWQTVGAEYLKDIEEKLVTDGLTDTLDELVTDGMSEQEKIDRIAGFVQSTLHYKAIEFGDRALIPNTAKQTLANRYGDCKDHAVLLNGLLNEAGWSPIWRWLI